MPRYNACVIYSAQNNYLIDAATIEAAAEKAEKEFNSGKSYPVPVAGACLDGVTDLGTAWRRFSYVGTIQELPAGQEYAPRREDQGLCPNCGAKSAIVLVPPDDVELAVCDTCGWESTDKDPTEEVV